MVVDAGLTDRPRTERAAGISSRHPDGDVVDDGLGVYAAYACLRQHAPVLADPHANSWTVFRYADVRSALRDPSLSSAARIDRMTTNLAGECPAAGRAAHDLLSRQLETMDGPEHDVLRARIGADWSSAVGGAAALIESAAVVAAASIRAAVAGGHSIDLVQAVAEPLPLAVVLSVLGVPPDESDDVAAAVHSCAAGLSAAVDTWPARRRLAEFAQTATGGLAGALRRRGEVDVGEVVANVVLAVAAGHRTTSALIAASLAYLLDDESLAVAIHERPDCVGEFVDEMLRLESPVQAVQREAIAATVIGGTTIPQGALVTLSLGSANRDEAEFDHADRVLFGRRSGRHLAFGHGTHRCLGASLARMQAASVVTAMKPLLASLVVTDTQWNRSTASCSLQRLVVVAR